MKIYLHEFIHRKLTQKEVTEYLDWFLRQNPKGNILEMKDLIKANMETFVEQLYKYEEKLNGPVERMFTQAEAARVWQCHRHTIMKLQKEWRASGVLKTKKIPETLLVSELGKAKEV